MNKKSILTIFICIIIFSIIISITSFYSYKYLKDIYPQKIFKISKTEIILNKDESLKQFSKNLEKSKIIDNYFIFYLWVKFFSNYTKYQSGRYLFDGEITAFNIDNTIKSGKVFEPIVLKITIPEGFNYKQICKKISDSNIDSFKNCFSFLHDNSLLERYHIQNNSIEGFLFPSTYSFIKFPSSREVIEKMIDTFFKKLPSDYIENISQMNLSLDEAVAFASLIELESADPKERTKISGVIWNRLKANMPLGIDASIIYGIKNYKGNISKANLDDKDNKFNTRKFLGLPPTPIASPSLESLLAVITPEKHKYYYYVLNYRDKKNHLFSKNLTEHNVLVRKLIKSYKLK